MSYAELYGPAMECKTQEEADVQLERIVKLHAAEWGGTRKEATAQVRQNLGYYSGYYGRETMERVQRLFRCIHPVYGKINA